MNRSTKKIGENVYANNINRDAYTNNDDLEDACINKTNEVYTKLGQLEDKEERLGIKLLTLLEALINGFYYKDDDYGIIKNRCTVGIDTQFIFEEETNLILEIKDYGKTWSLDKQDLIKENKYE